MPGTNNVSKVSVSCTEFAVIGPLLITITVKVIKLLTLVTVTATAKSMLIGGDTVITAPA